VSILGACLSAFDPRRGFEERADDSGEADWRWWYDWQEIEDIMARGSANR
jgi:hypothetical protein